MVSIAMTTYNGEKYLREQLDSILGQTYTDFELVICDDCSTDSTREILEDYTKKDARIQIHINETNIGFKKNFEKAISFCKGDYIAFCDQDDVWEDFKLQVSIDNIGEKCLLCTDSLMVDSNLNSLGHTLKDFSGINQLPSEADVLLRHIIHHGFAQGATILASSSFIRDCLPIPDACIFHDWYFIICSNIKDSFIYIDKPTIKYRQHDNNVTTNQNNTLFHSLIPAVYERKKVLESAMETICLINLVLADTKSPDMKHYLLDSKNYYEALPDKKFYTVKYTKKYYRYMTWNYSRIRKLFTVFKKFCGVIWFKLFMQRKF